MPREPSLLARADQLLERHDDASWSTLRPLRAREPELLIRADQELEKHDDAAARRAHGYWTRCDLRRERGAFSAVRTRRVVKGWIVEELAPVYDALYLIDRTSGGRARPRPLRTNDLIRRHRAVILAVRCRCGCGEFVQPDAKTGRPRVYASDACRARAYRKRRHESPMQ